MSSPHATVWPGFVKRATTDDGSRTRAAMSNDKWLRGEAGPAFEVTPATSASDGKGVAQVWMRHPAYKMTLASSQRGADANDDGVIDHDEFRSLLSSSGYTGSKAAELFAKIDADGDGKLTEAEIKQLSQGQATLKSGKVR